MEYKGFGLEKFAKVAVKEWLTCIENHIEIMSKRLLENNIIELGNALLDMYAICGNLDILTNKHVLL